MSRPRCGSGSESCRTWLALCLLSRLAELFQAGEAEPRAGKPATRSIRERGASRVLAEGRVAARPGALVTVGAELGGLVESVAVQENCRPSRRATCSLSLRSDDRKRRPERGRGEACRWRAEVEVSKREYQRPNEGTPTPTRPFTADIDMSQKRLRGGRRSCSTCQGPPSPSAEPRLACVQISSLSRGRDPRPVTPRPARSSRQGSRLVSICDLSRTWIEAEVDQVRAPLGSSLARSPSPPKATPAAPWPGCHRTDPRPRRTPRPPPRRPRPTHRYAGAAREDRHWRAATVEARAAGGSGDPAEARRSSRSRLLGGETSSTAAITQRTVARARGSYPRNQERKIPRRN